MPRARTKHPMSPRRCRRVAACFAAAALASLIAWGALRGRDAWRNPAGTWPRYVDVDEGVVMLLSSMWKPSGEWHFAWQYPGWIYDSLGRTYPSWRPAYTHIGNTYGTAPGQYSTKLDAITVPIWWFSLAFGAGALFFARRSHRAKLEGMCANCGYNLAGIEVGSPCPECGRRR